MNTSTNRCNFFINNASKKLLGWELAILSYGSRISLRILFYSILNSFVLGCWDPRTRKRSATMPEGGLGEIRRWFRGKNNHAVGITSGPCIWGPQPIRTIGSVVRLFRLTIIKITGSFHNPILFLGNPVQQLVFNTLCRSLHYLNHCHISNTMVIIHTWIVKLQTM